MFPSQVLQQHGNFSGSAEELIALIEQVTDAVPMGVSPGDANERLIRHYVAVRVLDRPQRAGKGVVYGFRQLLQYLVARRLLGNGFQLAKIAEYTGQVPTGVLLKSLDEPPQRSEAQLLIEAYRSPSKPPSFQPPRIFASKRFDRSSARGSDPAMTASFMAPDTFGAPSTVPVSPAQAPAAPEPVLSMIDLADRFERTSQEQRERFEILSERLERHLELRLAGLEKQLFSGAAHHGIQGGDECREQYRRIREEMHQMRHVLQSELYEALEKISSQQQQQVERLLHELVGRLERVLMHQEETERALAALRTDVRALQRGFVDKPPNKEEGGKP